MGLRLVHGPFETWDAIGVEKSVARMEARWITVPAMGEGNAWQRAYFIYKEGNGIVFYYHNGEYKELIENPKVINLKAIKKQKGVIKKNSGASLIDIGDGVVLLEFTSPNNAIGLDIMQMINAAVDEAEAIIKAGHRKPRQKLLCRC